MKYLRQALILAAITFAAEIIKYLLPLPIPVSIYGLALLFFLLKSGLLPLEQIQDVGNLLLELMPLLLVPASVSFITALDTVQAMLLPVLIMGLLGTLLVMAVTGLVAQRLIRRGKEDGAHEGAVQRFLCPVLLVWPGSLPGHLFPGPNRQPEGR